MWLLLSALVVSAPTEQACRDGSPVSWAEVPSPHDFVRVVTDRRDPPEVRTVLDCWLDASGHPARCVVTREDPVGYGYGDMALRVASKFKMKVAPGESPEGRCVRIPMVWRNQ